MYVPTCFPKSTNQNWKWELTQLLHGKGYSEADVLQVYVCLDWLLAMPEAMERRFEAELSAWEEERKVPYITSYERFGMERGQQEMLLKILRTRFKEVPKAVEEQVRKMDQATLDQMAERVLTAQTLAEMGLGSSNGANSVA